MKGSANQCPVAVAAILRAGKEKGGIPPHRRQPRGGHRVGHGGVLLSRAKGVRARAPARAGDSQYRTDSCLSRVLAGHGPGGSTSTSVRSWRRRTGRKTARSSDACYPERRQPHGDRTVGHPNVREQRGRSGRAGSGWHCGGVLRRLGGVHGSVRERTPWTSWSTSLKQGSGSPRPSAAAPAARGRKGAV